MTTGDDEENELAGAEPAGGAEPAPVAVTGTRDEETTVLRAGQSVTVAAHEVTVWYWVA